MLDFLNILEIRNGRNGIVDLKPDFRSIRSSDLMIRGRAFYAIWDEENQKWDTDPYRATELIDQELSRYAEKFRKEHEEPCRPLYLVNTGNGSMARWRNYCEKDTYDNYVDLDSSLVFSNTPTSKKLYSSKRLDYPLVEGEPVAWNRLMEILYAPEERHKIEWAIGSVVNGDSKKLQKFVVIYGAAGTGKGTVLEIILKLFGEDHENPGKGYCGTFEAKELGRANADFSMEAFKDNPLVAVQMDGDLSKIEDNTRINTIVSHEVTLINTKYHSAYPARIKAFLFMGTNKPVKITDAKSGLTRRLIDVCPTGNKIPPDEYDSLMSQVQYELGFIASHCKKVYEESKHAYDRYIPIRMMSASNDFYNFIEDNWYSFKRDDHIAGQAAWKLYRAYCEDANIAKPMSRTNFMEELKNYFKEYEERHIFADGSRVRNWYSGFEYNKYENADKRTLESVKNDISPPKFILPDWLQLKPCSGRSRLDMDLYDCPAQYACDSKPSSAWDNVHTRLEQLDPTQEHYVRPPLKYIVIDFDYKDESGNKLKEKNLEEASKWPATYAELSKSGGGLHLHYIYLGDPTELKIRLNDSVEVKVFTGKSSLRRKLTECNDIPITSLSGGIPLKEVKKMLNLKPIEDEKHLQNVIIKILKDRELPPENRAYAGTVCRIDHIYDLLESAYESGFYYDISGLKVSVLNEASKSTHNKIPCIQKVGKMHFKSKDDISAPQVVVEDTVEKPIVFFDVEVMPNLFVICWKKRGKEFGVCRMINPTGKEVAELINCSRLVGFNCRRYDNHILYGRMMGLDNHELYLMSKAIISGEKGALKAQAYDISYTDIYDFSTKKQSLKKFEIELGIHHKELGMNWDEPVPEDMWATVAEYCENDVIATEATFEALQSDFLAREMLADIAGMNVNTPTNTLTAKIIFGDNKHPQSEFKYRNLALPVRPAKTT